jgi:MFS family permease
MPSEARLNDEHPPTSQPSQPPSPPGDAAAATLPYESPPQQKVWHVGTLTYTTAGLVVLFCWLLWGDFAWSMKERSVSQVVQLLLRRFQASDTVAATLITSLPAAIGIVLGPIISYRSDRHRGRWGRRIPYLMLTTPIAAGAIILLAFCPAMGRATHAALGASSPGENTLILLYFALFWTIFEFGTVAANAVFGGLINDVVPRPFLGRFFGLFRALSLIAGMVFNFWLLGKAEAHFEWVFIGVGLLYGVGFTMMCLKVKEGDYPPPPPAPPQRGTAGFIAAARIFFRECFSNPYYGWVFVAWMLGQLAFIPVNSFNVYFAKSINMDMDTFGKYIALTYTISLVLSYPLGALADRFHPLRVAMAAMVLYAITSFWGGFFALTAGTFTFAYVSHGVISGMYFTTSASLQQRLFPHSRFAQFASAATMVTNITIMLAAPIVGRILDYTHHVYRYTFLMGGIITICCLISFAIVHRGFMRLGGPKHYIAPGENEPQPEKSEQAATRGH